MQGGFTSFPAETSGPKIRDRSESFFDHFSQATMFYNSQTDPEKQNIAAALEFELAKCDTPAIRERMIGVLQQVDQDLADAVAAELGIVTPVKTDGPLNKQMPADADVDSYQPVTKKGKSATSDALSLIKNLKPGAVSRKVAILAADGFNSGDVKAILKALNAAGAHGKIVSPKAGMITAENGDQINVDYRLRTVGSVLFDAVFVAGGKDSIAVLSKEAPASLFVNESYMHLKAIGGSGEAVGFIETSLKKGGLPQDLPKDVITVPNGVVTGIDGAAVAMPFVEAISKHRVWDRALKHEIVV